MIEIVREMPRDLAPFVPGDRRGMSQPGVPPGSGILPRDLGQTVFDPWAEIVLSATQTTNLSVGHHIQFDRIAQQGDDDGDIAELATGSGQANGIVTLRGGLVYAIEIYVSGNLGGTNRSVNYACQDASNANHTNVNGVPMSFYFNAPHSSGGSVLTPRAQGVDLLDCTDGEKVLKVRKTGEVGGQSSWNAGCRIVIRGLP